MRETKADLLNKLRVTQLENEQIRAENYELRKFVNYVRWLKTDEEFLKLKEILAEADKKFLKTEE